MARKNIICTVVIACVFLHVDQARCSFFSSYFQGSATSSPISQPHVPQPIHHPEPHHHLHHQIHQQHQHFPHPQHLNQPQPMDHTPYPDSSNPTTFFTFPAINSNINNWKSNLQQMQSKLQTATLQLNRYTQEHLARLINRNSSVDAFYAQCGTAVRHCDWVQSSKVYKKQVYFQGNEGEKPQMEHICYVTKHICVGNTETCISERNCDVAMKVTEMSSESPKWSKVVAVSHINNCRMESQSVSDGSRMPQMLFGIGFATYDATNQNLECRTPSASDFKLIFLWKNSSEAAFDGCRVPPKEDIKSVRLYDFETIRYIEQWPQLCNALASKEGGFQLKTFLNNHVPNSHFTTFFAPPFSFADNFVPTLSSNGMVVTGVVNA